MDQQSDLLDGRITAQQDYGVHIRLTCKNHPRKFWSTKNIAPIGCRHIFWDLWRDSEPGGECDCSWKDLRVAGDGRGR